MKKVVKTWGWEHWFANTGKYCGKLIYVEFCKWSSKGAYHHHKIKDETFFIIEGSLFIEYEDKEGKPKSKLLFPDDSFRVSPNIKHRFTSYTSKGCKFIEASTHHDDEDSYRDKI